MTKLLSISIMRFRKWMQMMKITLLRCSKMQASLMADWGTHTIDCSQNSLATSVWWLAVLHIPSLSSLLGRQWGVIHCKDAIEPTRVQNLSNAMIKLLQPWIGCRTSSQTRIKHWWTIAVWTVLWNMLLRFHWGQVYWLIVFIWREPIAVRPFIPAKGSEICLSSPVLFLPKHDMVYPQWFVNLV